MAYYEQFTFTMRNSGVSGTSLAQRSNDIADFFATQGWTIYRRADEAVASSSTNAAIVVKDGMCLKLYHLTGPYENYRNYVYICKTPESTDYISFNQLSFNVNTKVCVVNVFKLKNGLLYESVGYDGSDTYRSVFFVQAVAKDAAGKAYKFLPSSIYCLLIDEAGNAAQVNTMSSTYQLKADAGQLLTSLLVYRPQNSILYKDVIVASVAGAYAASAYTYTLFKLNGRLFRVAYGVAFEIDYVEGE